MRNLLKVRKPYFVIPSYLFDEILVSSVSEKKYFKGVWYVSEECLEVVLDSVWRVFGGFSTSNVIQL